MHGCVHVSAFQAYQHMYNIRDAFTFTLEDETVPAVAWGRILLYLPTLSLTTTNTKPQRDPNLHIPPTHRDTYTFNMKKEPASKPISDHAYTCLQSDPSTSSVSIVVMPSRCGWPEVHYGYIIFIQVTSQDPAMPGIDCVTQGNHRMPSGTDLLHVIHLRHTITTSPVAC